MTAIGSSSSSSSSSSSGSGLIIHEYFSTGGITHSQDSEMSKLTSLPASQRDFVGVKIKYLPEYLNDKIFRDTATFNRRNTIQKTDRYFIALDKDSMFTVKYAEVIVPGVTSVVYYVFFHTKKAAADGKRELFYVGELQYGQQLTDTFNIQDAQYIYAIERDAYIHAATENAVKINDKGESVPLFIDSSLVPTGFKGIIVHGEPLARIRSKSISRDTVTSEREGQRKREREERERSARVQQLLTSMSDSSSSSSSSSTASSSSAVRSKRQRPVGIAINGENQPAIYFNAVRWGDLLKEKNHKLYKPELHDWPVSKRLRGWGPWSGHERIFFTLSPHAQKNKSLLSLNYRTATLHIIYEYFPGLNSKLCIRVEARPAARPGWLFVLNATEEVSKSSSSSSSSSKYARIIKK